MGSNTNDVKYLWCFYIPLLFLHENRIMHALLKGGFFARMAAQVPDPYYLPLLLATAVCLVLIAYTFRRRSSPGKTAFTFLMIGLSIWSLSFN